MTRADALMTEAEKLAKVVDELTESFARELGAVLRELEREARRLVFQLSEATPRTSVARAVRLAKARRQLKEILRAAGYPELAETATSRGLDRLLAQLDRLRDAARLTQFTTTDLTRISALKALAEQDLLAQGDEIATAIWRTLKYSLFSGRKTADLIEDLADAIDVELTEARTFYDTTVNIFARQVEALKSTDEDVFAYMGPADIKTRPFCHQHVGKVYTKAEIDAMDNGQLPNVFLTGGGFNCRHSWIAVSKLSELRELVGTNQRIPEVTAQIGEVGTRKAA